MFKNITLEISLKPFKKTDGEYIRGVAKKIFTQWAPLLKGRESISVMLWASDGSEILDYAGNLSDEFEWARFIGTANLPYRTESEPKETSLHERKQDYIENAPKMTYGILKDIISAIKEEGKKAFPDAKIRIGETFDIGPEFAISDFKYNRHREISSGYTLDKFGFVDATARLNGDTRKYAAYPDGIPDGTPFGTFLGKQSAKFLPDMGFDYLWLSNGLGFSANPWAMTGKIFDGEKYYPEKLANTKAKVFEFWKLFRAECDVPLRTRGTNNSVGIDYATDGVPLYNIYNADLDIQPPPNSPWAALNDNFGLELMGHMTRICELPGNDFLFRYYIHDPWWINSPWYDRYDGQPYDIYLPMSISRVRDDGSVQSATDFSILSIDNTYGNMPDSCVNEPLPHILKAEKDAPDDIAPFVWVYPMREYTTSNAPELLSEMNEGDRYICNAINRGLPLNCVASTDIFLKNGTDIYKKSVIITPVPVEKAVYDRLCELSAIGVGVIIYGSEAQLSKLTDSSFIKISIHEAPEKLIDALANFGYSIKYEIKKDTLKPPTVTVARSDNALWFSVYNSNTTSDALLSFPLGAPILNCGETEIENGHSRYRFSRSEHRECRAFVKQNGGVISAREGISTNTVYRRRMVIRGLKDATVCLFPENGCENNCAVADGSQRLDGTPEFIDGFELVHDEKHGVYLKGEHITGDIFFLMGKKK
jgi:hypothetical protein